MYGILDRYFTAQTYTGHIQYAYTILANPTHELDLGMNHLRAH